MLDERGSDTPTLPVAMDVVGDFGSVPKRSASGSMIAQARPSDDDTFVDADEERSTTSRMRLEPRASRLDGHGLEIGALLLLDSVVVDLDDRRQVTRVRQSNLSLPQGSTRTQTPKIDRAVIQPLIPPRLLPI